MIKPLTARLRESTEAMANQCHVSATLWDVHCGNCLEAAARIEALEAQVERLMPVVEFAKWVIREGVWDGSIEGGDIQHEAHNRGLIVKEPYDPDEHGDNEWDVQPGDDWYVFSPLLAAALSPGAR